jgi:hypothetical protein
MPASTHHRTKTIGDSHKMTLQVLFPPLGAKAKALMAAAKKPAIGSAMARLSARRRRRSLWLMRFSSEVVMAKM